MGNLYDNYAQLAAAEEEGVAYTRTALDLPTTSWASIAIHGGGIEAGSGELALTVGDGLMKTYVFAGIKASHNSDLHITATHFDEPQCLALLGAVDRTISFHGYAGTGDQAETAVGGLDTDLGGSIAAGLADRGFSVTSASSEVAGTYRGNICNKNQRGAGVQLELSHALRKSFFPHGDLSRKMRDSGQRTQRFYDYVEVIRSVTATPALAS
ncbi:poly-gamma-glutamate hydrolase family protein [Micromonospora sp. WMMD812]|uniref:poly-gamma-glutamate hydrolase family protein n=1 Tax=Micromonospora sp. WMMD812 TaxID=3015152 RepID=UPI00248C78B0|nr:poly-gamma-glutamate hydrolase family protein [Micromonospora sp. WMMD812]WBB68045.1 poly-gamma-glutamate hydrolase family protein [Micromonospora sp. WMMD812]